MRCRYCGAENPELELRCCKCQRRLVPIATAAEDQRFPYVGTAAAPALQPETAPAEPARPRLAAIKTGAGSRTASPVQPTLFHYRDGLQVVGREERSAPPPLKRAAELPRSISKPKAMPVGQVAFDFEIPAPPARPLTREIHRRADYAVAPLHLRAMAAMFDAGLAVGFTAAFLGVVRLCLGSLPTQTPFLISYGVAAVAVFLFYKVLWCAAGRPSLGLQGAHLHIVSFDGLRPTPAQRFMRLFAGCLSVASAGMGVVWALSDQESLTWHDHISQTILTHQLPEESS
ncbi:MAG: RDD family protein [Acidobacteria bacterium]|nr:RDD family protein [Acidobacteriota bacterium]